MLPELCRHPSERRPAPAALWTWNHLSHLRSDTGSSDMSSRSVEGRRPRPQSARNMRRTTRTCRACCTCRALLTRPIQRFSRHAEDGAELVHAEDGAPSTTPRHKSLRPGAARHAAPPSSAALHKLSRLTSTAASSTSRRLPEAVLLVASWQPSGSLLVAFWKPDEGRHHPEQMSEAQGILFVVSEP